MPAKNMLSGEVTFHRWRSNKKFPRQARAEGERSSCINGERILQFEIKMHYLVTWKHTKVYNTLVKVNM